MAQTNLTIKNIDCLKFMPTIPDKSIDMILCDLPFGITKNDWDSQIPLTDIWDNYLRIIKDNGVIALNADGMFLAELMMSQKKYWRYNLVWVKNQGTDFLNANRKPLKAHEEICIFYKSLPIFNKIYTQGIPCYRKVSKKASKNWGKFTPVIYNNTSGQRCPTTVLSFKKDGSQLHPTQKPVALCEWLIKSYTKCEGGAIVLDNCMGSGSTAIACINTNRNFIGCELNEKYYSIAKERIEKEIYNKKGFNLIAD